MGKHREEFNSFKRDIAGMALRMAPYAIFAVATSAAGFSSLPLAAILIGIGVNAMLQHFSKTDWSTERGFDQNRALRANIGVNAFTIGVLAGCASMFGIMGMTP